MRSSLAVLLLPFGNEQPEASYSMFTVVITLYLKLSVRKKSSKSSSFRLCIYFDIVSSYSIYYFTLLAIFGKLAAPYNKYMTWEVWEFLSR